MTCSAYSYTGRSKHPRNRGSDVQARPGRKKCLCSSNRRASSGLLFRAGCNLPSALPFARNKLSTGSPRFHGGGGSISLSFHRDDHRLFFISYDSFSSMERRSASRSYRFDVFLLPVSLLTTVSLRFITMVSSVSQSRSLSCALGNISSSSSSI